MYCIDDISVDVGDPSVQTIMEIMTPSAVNQKYLKDAGDLFNVLTGSKRPIIPDFYDCGTTARAIFMSLLNANRGNVSISQGEEAHMQNYVYDEQLASAMQKLEEMGCGVMICSLVIHNLNEGTTQSELGHVWIIEKKGDDSHRIYQSALNNYQVLDHMVRYGSCVDGIWFLKKLKSLVNAKEWSRSKKDLFYELFHYLPTIPLHKVRCSFHWTSIEY